MTISELRGFLAFMVKNNVDGVKSALKSSGYTPANSEKDLVNQLMEIYSSGGTNKLNQIFAKVSIDRNKATDEELISIREITSGEKFDKSAKFSLADFAALWGGSTVTTGDTSSTTTTPAVSPTVAALVLTTVVVIISVLILKS